MVMHKETIRSRVSLLIISAALAGGITLLAWHPGSADSRKRDTLAEYEVKAAFLLNFIKYVEWPAARAGTTSSDLVLCIAGENPFGEFLNLLKDKNIRGRKLVIRNTVDQNNLVTSHIIFIPASEEYRLTAVMSTVNGLPILTVSEIPAFAQRGGMINFITVDNKIRFEINLDAAQHVGIQISSQLLKLARIVKGL
jgi:hypothetical protein